MKKEDLYIIAEAALSYHGNIELCKLLVHSSKIGLANAIKFQIMYADDICVQPYQYCRLFKTMEMKCESWSIVREYAKKQELDFIADVFGERSFEVAEDIGVDAYKIHTTIFNEDKLVNKIMATNKKVFLSIGGLEIKEIEEFCKRFSHVKKNITLLFGYQAEPTELTRNYLARIPYLQELTGLEIGFMDHIDANSDYKFALSHVALGIGVRTFEKHIALCRDFRFENHISSLTPDEFKFYSQSLHDLRLAIGKNGKRFELSEEEFAYRKKAMKKVIAAKDIRAGHCITNYDIDFKRSDESEEAFYSAKDVINKITTVSINRGQIIKKDMLTNEK